VIDWSGLGELQGAAALGGVLGVVWLEATRIASRRTRHRHIFLGLSALKYLSLPVIFAALAFFVAGYSSNNIVGGLLIGFGIEGGPVAMGIARNGRGGSGLQPEEIIRPGGKGEGGGVQEPSLRDFFREA